MSSSNNLFSNSNPIDAVCKIAHMANNDELTRYLMENNVDLTKTNTEGKTVLEYLRDGPSMRYYNPAEKADYLAVINTLLLHGAPEIDVESIKDHYGFLDEGPSPWMAALVLMTGAKSLDLNLIQSYIEAGGFGATIKETSDLVKNYARQREAALASLFERKSPKPD